MVTRDNTCQHPLSYILISIALLDSLPLIILEAIIFLKRWCILILCVSFLNAIDMTMFNIMKIEIQKDVGSVQSLRRKLRTKYHVKLIREHLLLVMV